MYGSHNELDYKLTGCSTTHQHKATSNIEYCDEEYNKV